jgi:WhiB family redox-sensing transcriptional regulator
MARFAMTPIRRIGVRNAVYGLLRHSEAYPWLLDASCRYINGDHWYPEQGDRYDYALLVCQACPVRLDCLHEALRRGEQHGIWGGYTPAERKRMKL